MSDTTDIFDGATADELEYVCEGTSYPILVFRRQVSGWHQFVFSYLDSLELRMSPPSGLVTANGFVRRKPVLVDVPHTRETFPFQQPVQAKMKAGQIGFVVDTDESGVYICGEAITGIKYFHFSNIACISLDGGATWQPGTRKVPAGEVTR